MHPVLAHAVVDRDVVLAGFQLGRRIGRVALRLAVEVANRQMQAVVDDDLGDQAGVLLEAQAAKAGLAIDDLDAVDPHRDLTGLAHRATMIGLDRPGGAVDADLVAADHAGVDTRPGAGRQGIVAVDRPLGVMAEAAAVRSRCRGRIGGKDRNRRGQCEKQGRQPDMQKFHHRPLMTP